MRLIVIADTHITDNNGGILSAITKELDKADLIIHAGDFTSLEFYDRLKKLKPLKAVYGNMDCSQLQITLKEKESFDLLKHKIGLMHGYGAANNVLPNIKKNFNDSFDLVIFGHSHSVLNKKEGKTLFFNPGSPTDKIFAEYNSFGVIEIDKEIKAWIIKI